MFQAEYGVTTGEVMFRSAASDGKTVRFIEEGQLVCVLGFPNPFTNLWI